MNATDLKRVISELEVTLRNLKIKVLDAGNEVMNIHKNKLLLLANITKLKREEEMAIKEVGWLKKRVSDANAKIKEGTLALAKERAGVDQQKAQNADGVEANNTTIALIKKEHATLEKQRLSTKAAFAKLVSQESKNTKDLADLKQRESNHSDNVLKFSNKEKALKQRNEDLDREKDELTDNLDATKSLKAKYEAKIEEANREKARSVDAIRRAKMAEEGYGRRDAELDKREAVLEVRSKNLDQRGVSLGKRSIALQENQDAFDVKRLRLEKAQRDGNVKEELKKLREEMKK